MYFDCICKIVAALLKPVCLRCIVCEKNHIPVNVWILIIIKFTNALRRHSDKQRSDRIVHCRFADMMATRDIHVIMMRFYGITRFQNNFFFKMFAYVVFGNFVKSQLSEPMKTTTKKKSTICRCKRGNLISVDFIFIFIC